MKAKAKKSPRKARVKKEKIAGKADHYYDHIKVLTMTLKAPLKIGDLIHIKGHTTDFIQTLVSMQIDHKDVKKAKKGDGVGIKVDQFVRDNDVVYFAGKKIAAKPKASPVPLLIKPQQKDRGPRFMSF